MRVFGLTVGRNEADRYLEPMLWHMHGIVDGHFFYDDQSDDETAKLAVAGGCAARTRADIVPSFIENEGAFRGAAWTAFEEIMQPTPEDWVLVIDCDEVLVSNGGRATSAANRHREALLEVIRTASRPAVDLNIPEVFGFAETGEPLVRTDGFWGTIHAPRLFRYRPGGSYFHGPLGVPAVPNFVMVNGWGNTDLLSLMHYGYADIGDQHIKHARYSGQSGHGSQHVESIIAPDKVLVPWDRPFVREMRRG